MIVEFHGIKRCHKEWAAFLGITEQTMRWRIVHWGVERAVTTTADAPRGSRRPRNIGIADKERAVRAYLAGESEDDIAANLGVSRRCLSNHLIAWGLKRKGSAPTRTVQRAEVSTSASFITITIPTLKESA